MKALAAVVPLASLLLLGCMPTHGSSDEPAFAGAPPGGYVAYEAANGSTRVVANSCASALMATVETSDPAMVRDGPLLAGLVREASSAIRRWCTEAREVRLQGLLDGYQAFYARIGADTGWQLAEFEDIASLNARNQAITAAEADRIRTQGGIDKGGGDPCGYGAVLAGNPQAAALDALLGGAMARACDEDRQEAARRAERLANPPSGSCAAPRQVVQCYETVDLMGDDLLNRYKTVCDGQDVNVFNQAMYKCKGQQGWCDSETGLTYRTREEAEQATCG